MDTFIDVFIIFNGIQYNSLTNCDCNHLKFEEEVIITVHHNVTRRKHFNIAILNMKTFYVGI